MYFRKTLLLSSHQTASHFCHSLPSCFQVGTKLPAEIHIQWESVLKRMLAWGICLCIDSALPCTSEKAWLKLSFTGKCSCYLFLLPLPVQVMFRIIANKAGEALDLCSNSTHWVQFLSLWLEHFHSSVCWAPGTPAPPSPVYLKSCLLLFLPPYQPLKETKKLFMIRRQWLKVHEEEPTNHWLLLFVTWDEEWWKKPSRVTLASGNFSHSTADDRLCEEKVEIEEDVLRFYWVLDL